LLAGIVVVSVISSGTLAQPKRIRLSARQTSAQENQRASNEAELRTLEQQVDDATRKGDTTFLESVFATDFRFLHADGGITDKAESLQQVAKRPYTFRHLDAVKIEMHGDVAVIDGLVDVNAHGEHGNRSYLVKYVRVYQRRDGHWQMLMQRSVGETSPIAFDIPSSK
jgi:ketosteroid isomerase-like protein